MVEGVEKDWYWWTPLVFYADAPHPLPIPTPSSLSLLPKPFPSPSSFPSSLIRHIKALKQLPLLLV